MSGFERGRGRRGPRGRGDSADNVGVPVQVIGTRRGSRGRGSRGRGILRKKNYSRNRLNTRKTKTKTAKQDKRKQFITHKYTRSAQH